MQMVIGCARGRKSERSEDDVDFLVIVSVLL